MNNPSGGPPNGTTLAFDYGARRIGVAVGERLHATASGLTTLQATRGEPDWSAVDALVAQWQPSMLVVGVPRHADGKESSMAGPARDFAAGLKSRYNLPVELVDESLTSRAAESELREQRRSGMLRRRVASGDSDRIAARMILETWMSRRDDGQYDQGTET